MRTKTDIRKRTNELGLTLVNEGKDGMAFRNNRFTIIFSWGRGWEHLSIVLLTGDNPPVWKDMCVFKDTFWGEDETCVQYHPAKKDYINCHPNCLHIWKPTGRIVLPKPSTTLIGPLSKEKKNANPL